MKKLSDRDGNAIRGLLIAIPLVLVLWVAIIAFVAWAIMQIAGCCPLSTDYRKVSFRDAQRAFALLEPTPDLYETVTLEKVTIHMVGDRSKMDWDRASAVGSGVLGYAKRNGEIWVLGKMVNGKIVLNQAVLGHELAHIISWENPAVMNPDRYDDAGA